VSTSVTGGDWPADVIHVNEDGWVLVNRGREHGVAPGLRLLVVGQGIRELRDLFAEGAVDEHAPVLRIRRTYELLDVIHVEDACAIAIAARTPVERRPRIYRGPEGELLVWVPLPGNFTWPLPGETPDAASDTSDTGETDGERSTASNKDTEDAEDIEDGPPERGEQDDERWEEALPLNGVSVGDRVLPAIPAVDAAGTTSATASDASGNPFETGRAYDWMRPGQA
jgi:hypothetical protein